MMSLLVDPELVTENWAIFKCMKSARTVEREHGDVFICDAEHVVLFMDLEDKAKEETTRLPSVVHRLPSSWGCRVLAHRQQ